jgi:hypothetical protein
MFFLLGFAQTSTEAAQEEEEIARAKIRIQITSGQVTRRAKKRDRIKAGDSLQIYISPEFDSASIYVMYDNQESVEQLYKKEDHQFLGNIIVIPGEDRYTIDGKHQSEQFTIICSPQPLSDIDEFLESQARSPAKWQQLEQQLIEQSQLDVSDEISKPWRIAGAVRGDPFLAEALAILEKSPIFSGKTLVIRKYELRVEK